MNEDKRKIGLSPSVIELRLTGVNRLEASFFPIMSGRTRNVGGTAGDNALVPYGMML